MQSTLICNHDILGITFDEHKTALLAQSCSLRSLTLTPTYRRLLVLSLKSIINAFLDGQLVSQVPTNPLIKYYMIFTQKSPVQPKVAR